MNSWCSFAALTILVAAAVVGVAQAMPVNRPSDMHRNNAISCGAGIMVCILFLLISIW